MSSRHKADAPPVLRNRDRVPASIASEIDDAVSRATTAGAKSPLTYVGAGATGIVLTDRFKNRSFKVARGKHGAYACADEAEWFRTACRTPDVRKYVACPVTWDAQNGVLIKPYIKGRPGTWGDDKRVFAIHDEIARGMKKRGWTAPERKEDSFVVSGGSEGRESWRGGDFDKATLVDAGSALRVGRNLIKYAIDIAEGRREPSRYERLQDLAFYIYRERKTADNPKGTIPVEEVQAALARLRSAGGEFEWDVA